LAALLLGVGALVGTVGFFGVSPAQATPTLTAGPSVTVSATQGTNTGTVDVGSFTDSNALAPIVDFTANINWGDGSPVAVVTSISQPGGVGTAFSVGASHTYLLTGTFTASVAVSGDGGTVTLLATVKVASPCASGTAHFLVATSHTGNFTGLFCVNANGDGTYTQRSVGPPVVQTLKGTGHIRMNQGVTTIQAAGATAKNFSLVGTTNGTASSFRETGSGLTTKTGTFTLS